MDINKVIENIKKNNMEAYYVENRAEALALTERLLNEGDTISCGGSVTLTECGIDDLMRSGKYVFLDRAKPGLTPDEIKEVYAKSFSADTYLCSANALTEKGELVNVDGRGNRVATLTYGPKNIICVVGINKIVKDVNEGFRRIKTTAAPLNAKRLGCNTPCAKTGVCIAVDGGMTDGCTSDDRICATYVVCGRQRAINRIKVILVGENLGY